MMLLKCITVLCSAALCSGRSAVNITLLPMSTGAVLWTAPAKGADLFAVDVLLGDAVLDDLFSCGMPYLNLECPCSIKI
jgi:hypothetical protein